MAIEKPGFEYTLVVKGLFGRNRKVKVGVFKLGRTEVKRDPTEVVNEAVARLVEEKVKPGAAYYVEEQAGTISDYGDGLSAFSFMLYTGTKLAEGRVGGV